MQKIRLTLLPALLFTISSAFASTITVPPGLHPGDTYRLIFITSQTTTAASSVISTYNTFVTNDANSNAALAALGTTWLAIGSTAGADALSNIGNLAVPVYRLDGTKVGNNTADLFDGSILSLVNLTEAGSAVSGNFAWTGSTSAGLRQVTDVLGAANPEVGDGSQNNANWLATFHASSTTALHMYAISGLLTVPTPEPSTVGSFVAGALLLLASRRRR